jgi:hypothetical protein
MILELCPVSPKGAGSISKGDGIDVVIPDSDPESVKDITKLSYRVYRSIALLN